MILVTGASGTVGSEVVRALGAVKSRVRAGYRTRPQNVPEGVESVALDYDRPNTLRPALKDVDTLFLVSNSITPELTVVDEARHAGVKRIVKLSVLRAAEEAYIFARWHRAVERHIEASGLEWTFLRSNGFMQNVVTYMAETIRTQSAIYSSGADGAARRRTRGTDGSLNTNAPAGRMKGSATWFAHSLAQRRRRLPSCDASCPVPVDSHCRAAEQLLDGVLRGDGIHR